MTLKARGSDNKAQRFERIGCLYLRQSLDTYSWVPAEKGTAKIIDNIERDNEVKEERD